MIRSRSALALKITTLSVVLGLLALGVWWGSTPRTGQIDASSEAVAVQPLPRPTNRQSVAPLASAAPATSPGPAPLPAPVEASAYAIVLEGLAQQTPQALAKARLLRSLCLESYSVLLRFVNAPPNDWLAAAASVHGRLPALPGETIQTSQQRQQALELVQRHCSALMHDAQAMNRDEITRPPRASPPSFEKDLQAHLAAQSYRDIGMTLISGYRSPPVAYFDGQPWGGLRPETYLLAVHFAMWMNPQPIGRMAAQLDLAIQCIRDGHCTEEDVALHVLGDKDPPPTPEMLAQARALAPRIFAAMKAGRVEPFLAPWDARP